MTDHGPAREAELRRELDELHAENLRLQALLGLNQPSRRAPITPWEPMLLLNRRQWAATEALRAVSERPASSERTPLAAVARKRVNPLSLFISVRNGLVSPFPDQAPRLVG